MKKQISLAGMSPVLIRLGIIYYLALTIYFLFVAGLSDLPRVWVFIGLVAACFYFVMQAMVNLLTWLFCFLMKYYGKGLGLLVVLIHRLSLRLSRFRAGL